MGSPHMGLTFLFQIFILVVNRPAGSCAHSLLQSIDSVALLRISTNCVATQPQISIRR